MHILYIHVNTVYAVARLGIGPLGVHLGPPNLEGPQMNDRNIKIYLWIWRNFQLLNITYFIFYAANVCEKVANKQKSHHFYFEVYLRIFTSFKPKKDAICFWYGPQTVWVYIHHWRLESHFLYTRHWAYVNYT